MSYQRSDEDFKREARGAGLSHSKQLDYIHEQQAKRSHNLDMDYYRREQKELEERAKKAKQQQESKNRERTPSSNSNVPSDSNYFDLMVCFGIIAFCIMNTGTDQKLPTSPVTLDIKAGLSGAFLCAAKGKHLDISYSQKGYLADGSETYIRQKPIIAGPDGYPIDLREISKEAKSCADAARRINALISPNP